nr:ATP-grasp domain-containing protein [Methanobrevibacter oralis]
MKEEFKTPETFLLNDVDEAFEIKKNNPNKRYIIKPIKGSGGYDINILNNDSYLQLNNDEKFILQEHIEGINLSSSILGSSDTKKQLPIQDS